MELTYTHPGLADAENELRLSEEMPEQFVIKPFLVGNRAEVKSMLLTEYDEEKVKEQERKP